MKRLILCPFVLVTVIMFVGSSAAQERPAFGELFEIKNKVKVYVEASSGDRNAIAKAIKKQGLSVVSEPNDAEFFISFESVGDTKSIGYMNLATGELKVYLEFGKQKRIVWSKEETNGAFGNAVAKSLIKNFLRDLKKIR